MAQSRPQQNNGEGLVKGSLTAAIIAGTIAFIVSGGNPVLAAQTFFTVGATTLTMGAYALHQAAKNWREEIQTRAVMVRSATSPHRIVLGRARVSGTLIYVQVTGADKEYIHMVVALAGHRLHGLSQIYLDDQPLGAMDGDGNVTAGQFSGLVRARTYLGDASQTADSFLVAESAGMWTTDHRGDGIAYIYLRCKFDEDAWPQGMPEVTVDARGLMPYDPRAAVSRLTDNPVLLMRAMLTADWGLKCTTVEIDDTAAAAAATLCEQWVDADIASIAVTADAAEETFSTAAEDARIGTGDRIVLTAGTVPAGLTGGATYYLIRVDRLRFRLALTRQLALEGTFVSFTTNGATVAFTNVHQQRYTANGSFTLDMSPSDMESQLRAAMAGSTVISGGVWRIFAGGYAAPTISIDEDDLRGPVVNKPRRARRDLVNTVRGVYPDPARDYAVTDYPVVVDADFVAQDGGDVIPRDIDQPLATNAIACQRLAKIEMRKLRADQILLPCKITALRAVTAETVSLTIAQLGITAQTYAVAGWKITGDDDGIGVDLVLRAVGEDVYAWTPADAIMPAVTAPLDVPDGRLAAAPTVLGLTSGSADLLLGADGTVISRIRVTWVHAVEPSPGGYEVQWKRSSDADYESRMVPRTENATYLSPVEDGAAYDVRVRTINTIGVRSAWLAGSHTVVGKTAPATAPTSLAVVAALGGYDIAVSACPDADYARTEIWEAISNDRATALRVFNGPGTRFARTGLPGSVTRWYWARHVDRSGNESTWFPVSASGGISAVTLSPSGGGVKVVTDASAITAGTGAPPPGGDDYWAVFSNHDGKIWRWSSAAGSYTKAADGGDIAVGTVAADRIVGATLSSIRSSTGALSIDAGGYIRTGAATWAAGPGVWIGQDAGAYKLRAGDPEGAQFAYDGRNLRLSTLGGGLFMTGGSIALGAKGFFSGSGIFLGECQNLILDSESMGSAAWSRNALTVSAGGVPAPDGVGTPQQLDATGGAFPQCNSSSWVSNGGRYTATVWLRQGSVTRAKIFLRDVTAGNAIIPCSALVLEGAPAVALAADTVDALDVTGLTTVWTRVAITSVAATTSGHTLNLCVGHDGASGVGSVAAAAYFYAWGAAVNEGAAATGYVPTGGAAVASRLWTWHAGSPAGNHVRWDGTSLVVKGALIAGDVQVDATGNIRGGQSGYNAGTGFFLGYSGGAYKFSLGTSSQGITWDGSTFNVNGALIATGNLLNNAVTNVQAAYTEAGLSVSTSHTTCQAVGITTTGKPVLITLSGYKAGAANFQIRIFRDATLLAEIPPGFYGGSNSFSHTIVDTPGAGSYTYSWSAAEASGTASYYNRSLVCTELKR